MKRYVIALDQGTTSSRAVLVDHDGTVVDSVQRTYQQIYPKPGWVEHNPQEILYSQLGSLTELVSRHHLSESNVAAIGIDNQRETTIVWDPSTGEPIANAIVWQCRRTAAMVEELCGDPRVARSIRDKTGLLPDAYFSASKIRWLLDNVPGARERAEAGELLFGTVDTWLLWVLSGGLVHATDMTNASRTMLYNIHECRWDQDLLDLFDILLHDARGPALRPRVWRDLPTRAFPRASPSRASRETSRAPSLASAALSRERRRTPTAPAASS